MNTVQLHHRHNGEGRPVIVLHGLFGSSRNWYSMTKKLSEHCRVITVDLRNHGLSAHTDTMNYPEMADDVLALAEQLGLSTYSVIGHSMGGKVAMHMALSRPGVIDNLVVLDIAPVEYRHRYGKIFTAMKQLPLHTIKNRDEAETLFCPTIGDRNLCRFLLQNLVRTGNGFTWRINLPVLENNIDRIADFPEFPPSQRFDGPSLFLGGSQSDFIVNDHLPVIRQLFPSADIQWLEQAGHMLHVEQPDAVFDKIIQFINHR